MLIKTHLTSKLSAFNKHDKFELQVSDYLFSILLITILGSRIVTYCVVCSWLVELSVENVTSMTSGELKRLIKRRRLWTLKFSDWHSLCTFQNLVSSWHHCLALTANFGWILKKNRITRFVWENIAPSNIKLNN
jgi:hypothetical protein